MNRTFLQPAEFAAAPLPFLLAPHNGVSTAIWADGSGPDDPAVEPETDGQPEVDSFQDKGSTNPPPPNPPPMPPPFPPQ